MLSGARLDGPPTRGKLTKSFLEFRQESNRVSLHSAAILDTVRPNLRSSECVASGCWFAHTWPLLPLQSFSYSLTSPSPNCRYVKFFQESISEFHILLLVQVKNSQGPARLRQDRRIVLSYHGAKLEILMRIERHHQYSWKHPNRLRLFLSSSKQ
jgi:hypothetical protein